MAETVGQRLKRLRLALSLSQRELAEPGVSYAYISRIEGNTRTPSVKALRKLAAKLGVSVEYLETGIETVSASVTVGDIDAAAANWAGRDGLAWADLTVEERRQVTVGLDEALCDTLAARLYVVKINRPAVSVVFPDLAAMLRNRAIQREDGYDYGSRWSGGGGVYRLTWVGPEWRSDRRLAGELYLVRVNGDAVVELLCVLPPVPCARCAAGDPCASALDHDPRPDANVEALLDGWADVCGAPGSVGWVRDRVWEALRAGWATPANVIGDVRGGRA